ncbi:hypothetical protein [Bradyrhizobium sp. ERR14]|uniref:hypothetical protein n=1 Tax=Bradyrhizobium sp. ERR14 TaxID=2663837 RepID=UPI001610194F|nr:hypothetical protein [Bradyrhizobium sp. ERR14]MBB4394047.1 hypothetical protein [Bradyrhizobium sp. ERR14]
MKRVQMSFIFTVDEVEEVEAPKVSQSSQTTSPPLSREAEEFVDEEDYSPG